MASPDGPVPPGVMKIDGSLLDNVTQLGFNVARLVDLRLSDAPNTLAIIQLTLCPPAPTWTVNVAPIVEPIMQAAPRRRVYSIVQADNVWSVLLLRELSLVDCDEYAKRAQSEKCSWVGGASRVFDSLYL